MYLPMVRRKKRSLAFGLGSRRAATAAAAGAAGPREANEVIVPRPRQVRAQNYAFTYHKFQLHTVRTGGTLYLNRTNATTADNQS